jgi:hypothetical protein
MSVNYLAPPVAGPQGPYTYKAIAGLVLMFLLTFHSSLSHVRIFVTIIDLALLYVTTL